MVETEPEKRKRFERELSRRIRLDRTKGFMKLTDEQLLQLIHESETATKVKLTKNSIVNVLEFARMFDDATVYFETNITSEERNQIGKLKRLALEDHDPKHDVAISAILDRLLKEYMRFWLTEESALSSGIAHHNHDTPCTCCIHLKTSVAGSCNDEEGIILEGEVVVDDNNMCESDPLMMSKEEVNKKQGMTSSTHRSSSWWPFVGCGKVRRRVSRVVA
jgi:hypothetical protein